MLRLVEVAARPDALKPVAPPACIIVNVLSSTMKVPVRAGSGFDATEKESVPLPVPLRPEGKVIQASLVDALHEHPAPAVMFTLPIPPEAGSEALEGEIE